MKHLLLIVIIISLLTAGCKESSDTKQVEELEEKIGELQQKIEELEDSPTAILELTPTPMPSPTAVPIPSITSTAIPTQSVTTPPTPTPTTPDTIPLEIKGIEYSNITNTISWLTNEPATSQIEYGKTPNYGSMTPLQGDLVINHSIVISKLDPNTSYHYRILCQDSSGNLQMQKGMFRTVAKWTKADSPFIIASNFEVAKGETLIIEPGVVIKFDSARAMRIDGKLVARGTESELIVFTSNQTDPVAGDWCNIVFTDSCVNSRYDHDGNYLDGSVLQYCTIEYGGGNQTSAVDISRCSLFVDHCMVRDNSSTGINVNNGGVARITNNTITNNYSSELGAGIAVKGVATIDGNTISSNTGDWGGGIFVKNLGDSTTITTITDNIIKENSASKGGGILAEGATMISENTIINNRAYDGGGLRIYNEVTVIGNTISNNTASRGGGIYARYPSSATISYNKIINNSATEGMGGGIDIQNRRATIDRNDIYGNTPYDIYNKPDGAAGSSSVDARNNWWGTTDEDLIEEYIYDWYDDASLMKVVYQPVATSPVSKVKVE